MKDDMHEEKLRTFRLFDGLQEDAEEEERRPVHVALALFFTVLMIAFVMGTGFIYALKFGGWV